MLRMAFTVAELLNEKLVLLKTREAVGGELWNRSLARKTCPCESCGEEIRAYYEYSWRPLTNRAHRMKRLCDACVLAAVERSR